ncbi:MAG: hypothetical protein FD189_484 [Elusimicrobia bacterium]|nr:MAG: hypothetical protein FD154_1758 [Elusimicrobiota bacterium]KAF0157470.1 MAG: hypothetical protein FD189_484 [Elusimicrobiota bacterium]
MKKITISKTEIVIAWIIVIISAAGLFAVEAPVPQLQSVALPESLTPDSNGDDVFTDELRAVEGLLKGFSYDRGMSSEESRAHMEEQVRKAREFFSFAKETVLPHTTALAAGMKDPAGMIARGRRMTEANPSSWQGYDFVATGSLLVDDPASALENFEKARAAAPEAQKDWYRYMAAGCHNAMKAPDKAMEIYEEVIAGNRNWIAVKSAYISASVTLIGRDERKAAGYFDKGLSLHTPDERAGMLAAGICDNFRKLSPQPESCAVRRL